MTADRRVLVVDDTDIMRQGTVLMLRMFGYEAEEAKNGEEALLMVQEARYSMILMDYNMPDMLGTTCTIKIRQIERDSGVEKAAVIIGMTASTELDVRECCLQSGMDDYVDKACTIEDLHSVLSKWLGGPSLPRQWGLRVTGKED